jgi:hypothetical protein
MRLIRFISLLLAFGFPTLVAAQDFNLDIKPILVAKCEVCHWNSGPGPSAPRIPFSNQDTANAWKDTIYSRINMTGPKKMPPNSAEPLTADELRLVSAWARDSTVGIIEKNQGIGSGLKPDPMHVTVFPNPFQNKTTFLFSDPGQLENILMLRGN